MTSTYSLLADFTLLAHVLFVAFVVLGLLLIVTGGYLNWHWVRNSWFRGIHLFAIGVVVVQAWLGIICPLTTLEMWLRQEAGEVGYKGSFVAHWLHRLLYYDAPAWVFLLAYSAFGFLVLLAILKFPPNFFNRNSAIRD